MDLRVNGRLHRVEPLPERSLLTVLRDELDLTGSKYGCGEGQCGACTVLVDGEAARSCLMRVGALEGKAVTTIEGLKSIEGLERDGALHPLQEAFIAEGAFQCGYCAPGMVLAAAALLGKSPKAGP
ncbi:MAG: (2Fe-2S)-binding protein, partial [Thermoanaerobaculia bacterium]